MPRACCCKQGCKQQIISDDTDWSKLCITNHHINLNDKTNNNIISELENILGIKREVRIILFKGSCFNFDR